MDPGKEKTHGENPVVSRPGGMDGHHLDICFGIFLGFSVVSYIGKKGGDLVYYWLLFTLRDLLIIWETALLNNQSTNGKSFCSQKHQKFQADNLKAGGKNGEIPWVLTSSCTCHMDPHGTI